MTIDQITRTEHELKVGDFVMKDCPNCGKITTMRYDGRSSEGMNPFNSENASLVERLKCKNPDKYNQLIRTYQEGLKMGNYTCQVEECESTFAFEDGHYKE